MWNRSKPSGYTSFRTFIFGITSQSMFPNGVIYEGVSEEPMSFRGESGANDSMIPMCDNLLQVSMPETPLTEILKDFRQYRPGNHRQFLEAVRDSAEHSGVREFAKGDSVSAALYLQALDQVRDFRWRHWCFTREYILKHTSHPTATGGSPIVTVRISNPMKPTLTKKAIVAAKPAPSCARSNGGDSHILPGHQWRRRHHGDCKSATRDVKKGSRKVLWRAGSCCIIDSECGLC